jgi:hypothetical protein
MLNKRGQQEPLAARALVEIIISVVAIVLLIALLAALLSVVFNSFKSADKEKAKALSTDVSNTLEWMEQQGKDSSDILVNNPEHWYIFVYNTGEAMPEKCLNKACVCVCPAEGIDSCQNNGVCNNPKLNSGTKLSASDLVVKTNPVSLVSIDGIYFDKVPLILLLKKDSGIIKLNKFGVGSNQDLEIFSSILNLDVVDSKGNAVKFKDEALNLFNSGNWAFKNQFLVADLNEQAQVEKNIRDYFSNYPKAIRVHLIVSKEGGYYMSLIQLEAGGEEKIEGVDKNQKIGTINVGNSNNGPVTLEILSR